MRHIQANMDTYTLSDTDVIIDCGTAQTLYEYLIDLAVDTPISVTYTRDNRSGPSIIMVSTRPESEVISGLANVLVPRKRRSK